MPESPPRKFTAIGRKEVMRAANKYAAHAKGNPATSWNGFMSGVEWLLKELDGKTVVSRNGKGRFVRAGTITGDLGYELRKIEFGPDKKKVVV